MKMTGELIHFRMVVNPVLLSLKRLSHGKLKLANSYWRTLKVGKLVPSHVKLASNRNTIIFDMGVLFTLVQWHSRRIVKQEREEKKQKVVEK